MPRIAVDAMGGDRGPAEVVAGALEAASDGLTPIMYGSRGTKTGGLELRETQGVIEMHEKPAEAVRSKPDSSLVSAVRAVSEGDADAVVSAGNTGALLAASDLNFAGNCEGRDILSGAADVVVTDGFTGNVTLKLLEGTIMSLLDAFREEIAANTRGTMGGLLIRPAARRLRKRLDPDTYGGAYLLGLRGLAVIAHGNSSRTAIANAVRLAGRGVEHDVVGRVAARMHQPAETV